MSTTKRWDRLKRKHVGVSGPAIVKEYNEHMGGVDLVDMVMSLRMLWLAEFSSGCSTLLLSMDGYYIDVTHSRRVCQSETSWIFCISQPTSVRVSIASTNYRPSLFANVLVAVTIT